MKRIIKVAAFALCCIVLSSCACEHEWKDATCTEPKTCTKCEKHEGEALGHKWIEATCTEPKTCSECGETEGEPLGHLEGEEVSSANYVDAKIEYRTKCSRCNKTISSKEEEIRTFVDNGEFKISAYDFSKRLNIQLNTIADCSLKAIATDDSYETFGVGIGVPGSGDSDAVILFASNGADKLLSYSDRNNNFTTALSSIYKEDSLPSILLATILTIDPSLSFYEAKNIGHEILENYLDGKSSYINNNIKYVLMKNGSDWVFGINAE